MNSVGLPLPRPHQRQRTATRRALRRLFSVALGGGALLAAGLAALLLGAWLRAPAQRVAVGPGDERALVGFYEREPSQGGLFRWSRPGAALFLYGFDGRPAIVQLRLNAARPGDLAAQVALHAGERAVGQWEVRSTWRRYMFLAPTAATGDTALTFDGDSFRPAGDERDLGVALAEAVARPADLGGAGGVLPPLDRSAFLLTLPLLAWMLMRRVRGGPEVRDDGRRTMDDGRWAADDGPGTKGSSPWSAVCGLWSVVRGPWSVAVALALLPLVVWAAARPAEAGYWLPTFGWPWWPLAPLALLGWSAVRSAPLAARWGVSVPAIGELRTPARWEGWLLTGITLVALGQRLYALGELPAGLWRDEARHGLIALRIWQDPGYRPVYVVEGADLPALLFYLAAPVVGLLGPGVASVRLVSAVAGALAPLALWWAARPLVGPRAALLGAALLAWSSWSLAMSRWGFPATLDQLLTLLAIGFALRALEGVENAKCKMQIPAALDRPFFILHFARAGILGALAAYAYHTGRLAPLTLAALVALRLGADRAAWRRALPGLVAASLAGLLVLAPLLRFIADDFAGYNRRTGAVAFYQEADAPSHAPLLLLLRNAERYLLMWHVAGDRNGRHHAPGAPMVDPVTGALLLAGLGLTLAARGDPARRLLPAWLALGLVPGLLSTGAPHAMRALPALAPACALAGVGLAALLRGLTKDQRPTTKVQAAAVERRHALVVGLSSVVLLTSLALNTWLYFYQMPRDARVQAAFDTSETAMGRVALAAARADDPALRAVRVFVPAGARTSDVLRFLTAGAPVGFFAAETGLSAPPAGQALLLLPAGASDELRAAAVAALGPGAHELAPPRDPSGAPVVLAYGVGQDAARLLEAALSRR